MFIFIDFWDCMNFIYTVVLIWVYNIVDPSRLPWTSRVFQCSVNTLLRSSQLLNGFHHQVSMKISSWKTSPQLYIAVINLPTCTRQYICKISNYAVCHTWPHTLWIPSVRVKTPRWISQEIGIVTITYFEKDKSSKLHPTLFLYEQFE
jgi:hypothetical protein